MVEWPKTIDLKSIPGNRAQVQILLCPSLLFRFWYFNSPTSNFLVFEIKLYWVQKNANSNSTKCIGNRKWWKKKARPLFEREFEFVEQLVEMYSIKKFYTISLLLSLKICWIEKLNLSKMPLKCSSTFWWSAPLPEVGAKLHLNSHIYNLLKLKLIYLQQLFERFYKYNFYSFLFFCQ